MHDTRLAKIAGLCRARGWVRFLGLLSFSLVLWVGLFAFSGVAEAQTTASEKQASGDMTTLGATEQVVLVGEGGEVEVLARIDTGAFYTSIGEDLAEDIGLDVENAETVTARSMLGEESRPLVPITMRVAGEERNIRATVADRSDVSDRMLIGRQDLTGFTVDTSRE